MQEARRGAYSGEFSLPAKFDVKKFTFETKMKLGEEIQNTLMSITSLPLTSGASRILKNRGRGRGDKKPRDPLFIF